MQPVQKSLQICSYLCIFFIVLTSNELPELCKEIMHALREKKELNLIIFT